MAATYATDFSYPLNRVRFLVSDKAARFDFQDEEIYYALSDNGYVGDPEAQGPKQEQPELKAAISLIEGLPSSSSSGDSVTIKTLTTTRTNASGVKDRRGILRSLYQRLNAGAGGGGGPVVEDGYACGRYGLD